MIDKILVAVDKTERGKSVFTAALSLAKATDASLISLHVLSEENYDYPVFPTYVYYQVLKNAPDSMYQQEWLQYEQQGINFLQDLTKEATKAGVDAEYVQLSGVPGWEICELASAWSVDLIVVGSRGLKGVKEMFIGSVSNYVTHHAPCSVLIVRADTDSIPNSNNMLDQKREEADSKQETSTNYFV